MIGLLGNVAVAENFLSQFAKKRAQMLRRSVALLPGKGLKDVFLFLVFPWATCSAVWLRN
jgi:hypothetical protein